MDLGRKPAILASDPFNVTPGDVTSSRWLLAFSLVLSSPFSFTSERDAEAKPAASAKSSKRGQKASPAADAPPPADAASDALSPAAAPAVTPLPSPSAPQAESSPPSSTQSPSKDRGALLEAFNRRIELLASRVVLVKAKVEDIQAAVLGPRYSQSRAQIVHRNEIGDGFVLERAVYVLDGEIIFAKEDLQGTLDGNKELVIFEGGIRPGEHDISVSLTYGADARGVLSNLQGYKYKAESRYKLTVTDGKLTKLAVVSYSKDTAATDTQDKIALRYDVEVGPISGESPASAPERSDEAPAKAPNAESGGAQ